MDPPGIEARVRNRNHCKLYTLSPLVAEMFSPGSGRARTSPVQSFLAVCRISSGCQPIPSASPARFWSEAGRPAPSSREGYGNELKNGSVLGSYVFDRYLTRPTIILGVRSATFPETSKPIRAHRNQVGLSDRRGSPSPVSMTARLKVRRSRNSCFFPLLKLLTGR